MIVTRRVVASTAPAAQALAALAMAGAFMLAGCDDAPKQQTQAAPAATRTAEPKVAQLSRDMVAAVSAGKTATAVGVHFALGAPPTIDKPLPVQIAIVPHRQFASVRAHFEIRDGMRITAGEDYGPITDVDVETALLHQLMLLPSAEGMFMVTTSVETEGDDGTVTRIFSIPVIVGPSTAPAAVPTPTETTNPAAAQGARQ